MERANPNAQERLKKNMERKRECEAEKMERRREREAK